MLGSEKLIEDFSKVGKNIKLDAVCHQSKLELYSSADCNCKAVPLWCCLGVSTWTVMVTPYLYKYIKSMVWIFSNKCSATFIRGSPFQVYTVKVALIINTACSSSSLAGCSITLPSTNSSTCSFHPPIVGLTSWKYRLKIHTKKVFTGTQCQKLCSMQLPHSSDTAHQFYADQLLHLCSSRAGVMQLSLPHT